MTDLREQTAAKSLCERDFVLWTETQAEALRAEAARLRANDAPVLDFDNLIEEIESLGRSERWQLVNRLGTVVEHLLKLEFSPAVDLRAGWRATVRRSREEIDELLNTSPSLRHELSARIDKAMQRTRRRVAEELRDRDELTFETEPSLQNRAYDAAELLDEDWFPEPH